ncbi:MAG: thiosulfate oxidation carrier complex protein SoxZ [Gammaproteobacteria bacterium]|nr:thiosulfate oxidation carrier complex protein SoxZ [Gammaproteobacteria bacterium]|tara:strand:- start:69947 stop:70255 length:309 start_codon:yes stop_codon:yes gene_type:complete
MSTIKIRAKESKGIVTVKALIKHPMETGKRKNKKTGELIPPHYIQEVIGQANGKEVIKVYWGPAVSKNPYLTFKYKGEKGDKVELTWVDNKGNRDSKNQAAK